VLVIFSYLGLDRHFSNSQNSIRLFFNSKFFLETLAWKEILQEVQSSLRSVVLQAKYAETCKRFFYQTFLYLASWNLFVSGELWKYFVDAHNYKFFLLLFIVILSCESELKSTSLNNQAIVLVIKIHFVWFNGCCLTSTDYYHL
jgi:hypothetical protein